MSTTKPRTDYPNLRQLLGTSFCKYTFDKDIADDEIQALKQFPVTNRQDTFKRHQLLEEMIETNMFTEMIFQEENPIEIVANWEEDIDLLALHKMKTFIKNTNK
tara:strand:- start:959 stop:1270 length:312 start_codon:yes stop_codon:yes gene_type:complete